MTKPWRTAAWRKKREEFLKGKKCEWCGSTKELAIHHKYHFDSKTEYRRIGSIFFSEYFEGEKNQEEYKEFLDQAKKDVPEQYSNICPKCESGSIYARKTISPKYRCLKCEHEFEEPLEKISTTTIYKTRSRFFSLFFSHHREEINKIFDEAKEKAYAEYLDFKDVMVLCKKCHYAIENGLVFCQSCNNGYHNPKYERCFKCFKKTDRGKKYTSATELLEYIHPWCGKTFKIQRQFWEYDAHPQACCCDCETDCNNCKIAAKHWK